MRQHAVLFPIDMAGFVAAHGSIMCMGVCKLHQDEIYNMITYDSF